MGTPAVSAAVGSRRRAAVGSRRRWATVAAAAALGLVAAACGGGGGAGPGATTRPPVARATTTTRPKPVVAPLTGEVDPTGATRTRPALTVKVENLKLSRPQVGIDAADLVYEEVVECDITRLAAVFQSRVPAAIGPVRSVRRTDQALVRPLGGIFVYSGGAPISVQSIETAPVVRFDESGAGEAMFRDPARGRPHNLFVRGPEIYGRATAAKGPPPAQFTYRRPGAPPTGGTPAARAVVGFGNGYATTWEWDAASGRWLRSIFGQPDTVASGARIAAANVVIRPVGYVNRLGGACGDEGAQADLATPGSVTVLTGGRAVRGTWSQPDPSGPPVLRDAAGRRIALAPGSTWVELPKPEAVITVG